MMPLISCIAQLTRSLFGRSSLYLSAALPLLGCSVDSQNHTLSASRLYIVAPAGGAPSVMYMVVNNGTEAADTLLQVTSPISTRIEMHQEMTHPSDSGSPVEMVHMMPVPSVEIPAKSQFQFSPGGHHIMITNPTQSLVPGDSIPVTLHFTNAGTVERNAAVISYSDVDTATTLAEHDR